MEDNHQELIEIKPVELIVKEDIKLRKEAKKDSKTIATVSKGKTLESIDHKKEWYTVLYNDEIAYVKMMTSDKVMLCDADDWEQWKQYHWNVSKDEFKSMFDK